MSAPRSGAALVTGAARRIGRRLALEAARLGYDVAAHVRAADGDTLGLRDEIEGLGRRFAFIEGDLADPIAPSRIVRAARTELGPLGLLVNNASLFGDDRLGAIDAAGLDAHLAINLRAPVLLMQAFAEDAPDGAQIINLTDQRVWRPTPLHFSYAISKAGLWQATLMAAQALAPRIRVNAIGPGPTLPSIHQGPGVFEREAASVPLARGASPDDIAAALAYLVSAPAVTGQMIAVDGGQHLAWRTPDVEAP